MPNPKFEIGDIVVFTEEMLRKSPNARLWSPQGPFIVVRNFEYGAVAVERLNGENYCVDGWYSASRDVTWGENYFKLDVFLNAARKAVQNAR